MSVLVLGGAGYIGSHAVDGLIHKGYDVIVVDNLGTGHRDAIHPDATFYQGDIRDKAFLTDVFDNEHIEGVFHFCAYSLVGESMEKPLSYFNNNVYGLLIVLEVMLAHHVKDIVFSSTAAVYGEPDQVPITEDDSKAPTSPYGESKLMMEKMIHWASEAHGIHYAALRYFNVAGAKADGSIGEDHRPETHLIPIVLQVALQQRDHLTIYGDDYDTPDGSCIRDYLHVEDLIEAHILAFDYLKQGGTSGAFNLGSSQGYSVYEILEAARTVTGKSIPAEVGERRSGDPSKLIASSDKARQQLNWNPQHDDINDIIRTAWSWHQQHEHGYNEVTED
ncbi:UDP-glucose 4-epimerase [Staphylococcus auricularis]|uniref:UDP-glucose 4-epimerase n=1 Tax=Staphylococcus auricularis TaxID=29379 RepID=A0AAP8PPE4_9STAP|nr:UDP-glucose 4-epimerase GalE [Staphylococcus auricularis]MBM0867322.1 UDP-glucose 4-epimerase GalE [Staphylococcus auricularis]MCG7341186.1 UDP-glucose 4-epimerase GalE [Staphylococcus auricularis]MDC6327595.1 UDP-glucose 4-epimerase GalE [Staphylococcus auricularis]MDN4533547.1 UDP-glucose 4-epimerase GalE [Staphylococcus auricularis]PNZ68019.1 UDP-glucose 4-epimerase GalE [Staphylococcus auricularis]